MANVYAGLAAPSHDFDLDRYRHDIRAPVADGELMLTDLVLAVEQANATQDSRRKLDIIKALVDKADAGANPILDRYVLLRLLAPHKDRTAVYGMGCKGLLIYWSKAVLSSSSKDILQRFIDSPQSDTTTTASADADDDADADADTNTTERYEHIACYPERAVFAALSCVPEIRHRTPCLTAREAAATCQRITHAYHDKERLLVSGPGMVSSIHGDTVIEELKDLVQWITPAEARFITIVLLRRVTHGVEPSTVWAAMYHDADRFIKRNNDFLALARWSWLATKAEAESPTGYEQSADVALVPPLNITVGTPFVPMTCSVARSPYLMQWLFMSSTGAIEEGAALPPKVKARLLVMPGNLWFVPVAAGGQLANNFADIDHHPASSGPRRAVYKEQLPILKGMRNAGLLDVDACRGLVISYVLTAEGVRFGRARKAHMHITAAHAATAVNFDDSTFSAPSADERADVPDDLSLLISKNKHSLLSVDVAGRKSKKPKAAAAAPKAAKVLVQEKYDGDRLLAHVMDDGTVLLFTRNGKAVENVYTDVRVALENAFRMQKSQHIPKSCILDGELIVVDKAGKPANWVSAKWKYDTGNRMAKRQNLAEAAKTTRGVVTLIFPDDVLPADDDPTTDISILPAATATEAFGTADNARWEARPLGEGFSLQYVIFDVLWYAGKPVHHQPCSQRLTLLKSIDALKHHNPFFRLVNPCYEINTSQELINLLQICIKDKREGLVLKDMEASYEFRRSVRVQKVKLKGPDVNCAVIGGGFRLTANPRMVCLITAICDDARESMFVYCRVEHFEGDHPSRVIEHVMSSPSRVVVSTIVRQLKSNPAEVLINSGPYNLRVSHPIPSIKHIILQWEPVARQSSDSSGEPLRSHTVHFWQGFPDDMQWVIAPSDCGFALSVHGDLRPLNAGENVDKSVECPIAAVPRFPVGRIEFDQLEPYANIDTASSTQMKYEHAQQTDQCVRIALKLQIERLRRPPLKSQNLLLALRILYGLDNPTVQWPQPKRLTFAGGGGKELTALLLKYDMPAIRDAERSVMFHNTTGKSQWTMYRRSALRSIVDGFKQQRAKRELLSRLQLLKDENSMPLIRYMQQCSADLEDSGSDIFEL
jgi:ATP dependent DNA ligase domain/DNA ligase N terminus